MSQEIPTASCMNERGTNPAKRLRSVTKGVAVHKIPMHTYMLIIN